MLRTKLAVALVGMAMFSGFVTDADASSVRVRCETRTSRSQISVDGRTLPRGTYTARVTSGANTAVSPAEAAVGGEVEMDFDSDRANIAAGATRIAKAFITNGRVRGEIVAANGTVVASATVACRVR